MFHCLFEQSGTFKNELKKLGYDAKDYDLRNDFGETDVIVDLFDEIEEAFKRRKSIFDDISQDDFILAFFPCTRFEDYAALNARCDNAGMKDWSDYDKLHYSMHWQWELFDYFMCINKLVLVCLERKIPCVIENPYSPQHYLTRYWCLKPAVIDKNRRLNGDWYKKPTQYWFIGCEPKQNFLFEPIEYVEKKIIENERNQVERSMIHPQYANRFLRTYILPV